MAISTKYKPVKLDMLHDFFFFFTFDDKSLIRFSEDMLYGIIFGDVGVYPSHLHLHLHHQNTTSSAAQLSNIMFLVLYLTNLLWFEFI